jgi:beta-galactosidase
MRLNIIRSVRWLRLFAVCGLMHTVFAQAAALSQADQLRERLSLDKGWLFHLGDTPLPEVKGLCDAYNSTKAGGVCGAAGLEFDDSTWRKLNLPHDWVVEGPFDPKANHSQGYRPRGIAWYRRYLRVEEADRGRHFELQFDAIATNATIWVNGSLVHHSWSGYSASYIDITPYLRYGDAQNTIAVRDDANAMEGWWYEGGGIYRHAWLVKTNPVHVISDGVHATPRKLENNKWQIPVAVTLDNSSKKAADISVSVNLYDPAGKLVTSQSQSLQVPVFTQTTAHLPIDVTAPELWSLEQTNLYRVGVIVTQGNKKIDETSLSTGFRSIRFDAEKGFFLNDQHLKLKGVCIHQDHAGVGVAIPDSIWEYRLRRLKELGVNAIRFSHNAPAAEVLDMVDRMGFVVMDENRNFNPSPDYIKQLEWMVRRDRHHPGIILWSVFNEEPVQGSEVGYEMVRRMVFTVKMLDDTRPVTAAMNHGMFNPINVSQAVDVVGFNYQINSYDRFHTANPTKPFTSSEDTSAFMTRGEFTTDKTKNLIASYDEDFAPWGSSHRDGWQTIDTRDYVAGGFVWTGFDYRGEPTPNEWPSVSSVFGIMDLNGFAKTAYYIHRVQWIKNRPLVYLAPHWNWTGKEGEDIKVMVMANVERVKLRLNGRDLGEQVVDNYRMNYFTVPFEAGRLEAVGLNGDKEVARASVETTGPAVALELVPDRGNLLGDGRDAMPITVRAIDAKGRSVPTADSQVTFDISGAGQSIGHGNGDPNSHEDEKGKSRQLFNGLAQLIVQSSYPDKRGASKGDLKIRASAPGLTAANVIIPIKASSLQSSVTEAEPLSFLHQWRIAPVSATRPDPNQIVTDTDMNNTWGWGQIPMLTEAPKVSSGNSGKDKAGHWRLYRTTFTPRKDLSDGSARIHFQRITGKAEVWLDGKLLGKKTSQAPGKLILSLPAGEAAHQINVLLQGGVNKPVGIDGLVVIEKK